MLSEYDDIPFPDRNWYALVAYNMGPGAVNQIQKRLQTQGKDPNQCQPLWYYSVIKCEMVGTNKRYSM